MSQRPLSNLEKQGVVQAFEFTHMMKKQLMRSLRMYLASIMIDIDDLLIPYEVDVCIYEKLENQDLIDHIDRVGISLSNSVI